MDENKESIIHSCSNSIRTWSISCLVVAIILFIAAFFVWMEEGSAADILTAGFIALLCRPLLRSLSLLVRNAETQLSKEGDMRD